MEGKELREGNLILFDSKEYCDDPKPFLRGMVDRVEGDFVILKSGARRKLKAVAGIPLTSWWMNAFGFKLFIPEGLEYVHQLQNKCMDATGIIPQIKHDKIKNPG